MTPEGKKPFENSLAFSTRIKSGPVRRPASEDATPGEEKNLDRSDFRVGGAEDEIVDEDAVARRVRGIREKAPHVVITEVGFEDFPGR